MKFNLVKFKPKNQKGLECLNCGQPFHGAENFCSSCGQKNKLNVLNFETFIESLFSGFFNYDSRVWKTFLHLIGKPGKVPKDFIEGKRARYVNPFQLYFNVSIIFFLIIGIGSKFDTKQDLLIPTTNIQVSEDSLIINKNLEILDTINYKEKALLKTIDSSKSKLVSNFDEAFKLLNEERKKEDPNYQYHSKNKPINEIGFFEKLNDFDHFYNKYPTLGIEQSIDSLGYQKTSWNKICYNQTIQKNKNIEKYNEDKKSFLKTFTSYLSLSLFFLLPFFALFLKLIYIRSKRTYLEHLVFVFNIQTVFFLILLVFYMLNLVVDMDNLLLIFSLIISFYLYKALRYFYAQKRFKTLLKFIILNVFYFVLAFFGVLIVTMLSFIV